MKVCTKCGIEQEDSAFNRRARSPNGLRPDCRQCQSAATRAYALKDPARYSAMKRNSKMKSRFKLTATEVDARLDAVNRRCEACGIHQNDTPFKRLVLDHDHACCPSVRTCGQCIRGVLCTACNVALGAVQDSLSRVESLADYLRGRST